MAAFDVCLLHWPLSVAHGHDSSQTHMFRVGVASLELNRNSLQCLAQSSV